MRAKHWLACAKNMLNLGLELQGKSSEQVRSNSIVIHGTVVNYSMNHPRHLADLSLH